MITFKKLFALSALVLLCSCAHYNDTAETPKFTEIRFQDESPIVLEVGQIEIKSEFTPTFQRPNVEHLFPVSIEKSARLWATDRLKASGEPADRTAEFIIKDASVTEEEVPSEKAFYKDNLHYKAVLSVVLRINTPDAHTQTAMESWREISIPVDTSIENKEIAWSKMTDKLMESFNQSMENNIRQYLNMYVKDNRVIFEY